ncbi:hypothetical protein WJX73_008439 [Symbiochloris irregularis]|uniref:Protein kinase domain-containing protein n=1 Tax=Symbiochloris irregularis TaxID=706552 RepID=A0AAW1P556_9CHLO
MSWRTLHVAFLALLTTAFWPTSTCAARSFLANDPANGSSLPQGGQIIAANASFVLDGVPFSNWTQIMTGTLQLVLVALIKEPPLTLKGVNLTWAYPTAPAPGSNESSTVTEVSITVAGEEQFHELQESLVNLTQPTDYNNALVQGMWSTNQFPGLSGASLLSLQPQYNTPPAPPGPTTFLPSNGLDARGTFGIIAAGIVVVIVLTAVTTIFVSRLRKRYRAFRRALPASVVRKAGCLPRSPSLLQDYLQSTLEQTPRPSTERTASTLVDELASLELAGSPARSLQLGDTDWLMAPDEIAICKRDDGTDWELGAGGFGRVYKAIKGGTTTVAVKVMGDTQDGQKTAVALLQRQEAFEREILLLKSCRDRHVVQFLGACMQNGKLMLVTEYLEGGNLTTALERDCATPPKFSWYKTVTVTDPEGHELRERHVVGLNKRVAMDIARGLAFLHKRKIVHRDVKSSNVLLARDGTAKLADVGLAQILRDDKLSTLHGELGTFSWAAPEILLGRACSEKVDIYSFGVVLWELSTGRLPEGRHLRELVPADDCPKEVDALMNACLSEKPSDRPSAVDIVHTLQDLRS